MHVLDQSFTSNNFRKIIDIENRKGVNLEDKFFPEVVEATEEIKNCIVEIRAHKAKEGQIPAKKFEKEKNRLTKKKESLKKKKEELLERELEKISSDITSGKLEIKLSEIGTPGGKKAYVVFENPAAYFAIKQIQYNIGRLYKVKQSNRYNIVCQLRSVLSDKFPKWVVRTDIKSFYENILNDRLISEINREPLLTSTSKKIIKNVLKEYKAVSGNAIGVPRGVGISAYMAELYMRKFDENIKLHPEIIFYARYVDDIVAVFAPRPNNKNHNYLNDIETEVQRIGLALNKDEEKTKEIDLLVPANKTLEYLGYEFSFGMGQETTLNLSRKKIDKYKKRMKLMFEKYLKRSKTNEKKARKLLVMRAKFLTGNTRLLNNKKNAVVGIYFSNSLITNVSCLSPLDDYFNYEIGKLNSLKLRERLGRLSFKEGFVKRKFYGFTTKQLLGIVKAWKHES